MSKWFKGNSQGLFRNKFNEWKYSKNELKLKAGTKKEMSNKRCYRIYFIMRFYILKINLFFNQELRISFMFFGNANCKI